MTIKTKRILRCSIGGEEWKIWDEVPGCHIKDLVKEVDVYYCGRCNSRYETLEEAQKCDNKPVFPLPHVGDVMELEWVSGKSKGKGILIVNYPSKVSLEEDKHLVEFNSDFYLVKRGLFGGEKLRDRINNYLIIVDSDSIVTNFEEDSKIRISTESEIEKICRENKKFNNRRDAKVRYKHCIEKESKKDVN